MIDTLRLRILLVMLSDWVNRQRGHDPRRRGRRNARARSKTRAALVQSDRKLMATTRAVLCGAVTMVRRLGQRVRTASPHARPVLQRAQDRLQQMGALVYRGLAQTRARVMGRGTHSSGK